ncbi:hypothetical protein GGTG_00824 [Gaeumannomyces tritici R3-111a-1]|uniref:Tyrosinase copper-binding domain-containing protein n=1 Tax=Gaeumannomyces tritici (strain R3-111a-1) TaxID=644352 RepID=J3NHT7_GAET3|nr:hypothetical protein GGTG_00824 [Gaeumannomyces tritici R3-111a-1]EJT80830.1 hypothetical protein GGTG_00824 [Gaeumannomyces tritici R3-111a-1]
MRATAAIIRVSLALCGLLSVCWATEASDLSAADLFESLKSQALANLKQPLLGGRAVPDGAGSGCSHRNTIVRKDWEALTKDERRDYTRAVKCLMSKPSQADPAFAPGARTRYDDFVAVHINHTDFIHASGYFLTWHRYFVWAYEKALRDECGYKGYQPYWNWFAYIDDPCMSPLFDGSDSSLSGDGDFWEHNGTVIGPGNVFVPSGRGGGCVTSGPFANTTINLGPIRPAMRGLLPSPTGPLGYNPRCLRRDLSATILSTYMTFENLLNITTGDASANIRLFQDELQGRAASGFPGMHSAGHFGVGGEAGDIYSSTNEPTFFLHHAMVDLMYWVWQSFHLRGGIAYEIAGTITSRNSPPSRDALKSDPVDLGGGLLGAETRPISDLLDTQGGAPLCYMYA